MFVSIYNLFTNPGKAEDKKDFGTFVSEINDPAQREVQRQKIKKITVQPRANNSAKYIVEYNGAQRKTVMQGPYFDSIVEKFRELGINYTVEAKEESTFWQSL